MVVAVMAVASAATMVVDVGDKAVVVKALAKVGPQELATTAPETLGMATAEQALMAVSQ